ncbi:MAG: zinc-dependent alcohol dehydrogenase family protein [Caldilinea sp.]|nr:zinc-dependent alcohol dehydrogenase family protein [Caldilinea sp.]MDW8440419.1 zinc-dependent alcohol dehydrogenase family protein [Caldilineaceae bacterium]
MKAVLFPAPESIRVERVPDPSCAPDEVVVQVARCGICGTDVHIYRNEYMSTFPVIPGHEFGGVIVEVGRDVTDFRVGERVAVDPNLYCGRCDMCRNEMANHCLNWQGVGITRPGGFAEYTAVPARACYRLPDSLSDAQAAFIEPLACVVHAMKRIRMLPADPVLILGAGPMGLLLIQALRRMGGSYVVAVEKQPARLQLARAMGASLAVPAGPDQDAALREVAPRGFGVVIDATGVPAVIEGAFRYLRPRGTYLQFGVAPNRARVSLNPYDIFRHDWTIVGSFALCYTFIPAIDWLASGAIDVAPLVSHTAPMERFAEVFQQFAAGQTLKVHIEIGQQRSS